MKSEISTRMISFMTFDYPLRTKYISAQFDSQHQHYQQQFPNWTFQATRRKVISNYLFREVLVHFAAIVGIGLFAIILFYRDLSGILLWSFVSSLISFLTLTLFIYLPTFYSDFLPKLDTIVAEQEMLSRQDEDTKICKRTQFFAPSLVVIFYVFCKIDKIGLPAANDQSAILLNKFFGTSKKPLKENLVRLYNISSLSPKERAEIRKGIEDARVFFEALDSPPAIQVLDQLELKVQRT